MSETAARERQFEIRMMYPKCARSTNLLSLPNEKSIHGEKARFDGIPRGCYDRTAGWSSLVARWAHNPKVGGSNPPPATNFLRDSYLQVTRILQVASLSRVHGFSSLQPCSCSMFQNVEQLGTDRRKSLARPSLLSGELVRFFP